MRWPKGVADAPSPLRGAKGFRWFMAEGAARWLPASLLDNPESFLLINPPQSIVKESPVRQVAIFSGPQLRALPWACIFCITGPSVLYSEGSR